MPSNRLGPANRRKPWAARVKDQGTEYFLGYFTTRPEACQAEDRFRISIGKRPRNPATLSDNGNNAD